ncbi:GIY-YIG nuclease family protein [Vibrio parahaemolyticus]|nr:GIY-YIG nuclease family protein [Vibrio parahaemolyticus]
MSGYIYCLKNESMPGIYKIGLTTKTVKKRCKEISAATGVPTPFEIVTYKEVDNVDKAEKTVHKLLSRFRLNKSREFFKPDVEERIHFVFACIGLDGEALATESTDELFIAGYWRFYGKKSIDDRRDFSELERSVIADNPEYLTPIIIGWLVAFEECLESLPPCFKKEKIVQKGINNFISTARFIFDFVDMPKPKDDVEGVRRKCTQSYLKATNESSRLYLAIKMHKQSIYEQVIRSRC